MTTEVRIPPCEKCMHTRFKIVEGELVCVKCKHPVKKSVISVSSDYKIRNKKEIAKKLKRAFERFEKKE